MKKVYAVDSATACRGLNDAVSIRLFLKLQDLHTTHVAIEPVTANALAASCSRETNGGIADEYYTVYINSFVSVIYLYR